MAALVRQVSDGWCTQPEKLPARAFVSWQLVCLVLVQ